MTVKNTKENKKVTQQTKPRQLSMAKVKRAAISTNKMEVYELNEVDSIRFYPTFPQSKINEMLKEYQEQVRYATEKDILLPEDKTLDYIYFLCIKYFTSLEKGVSDKYEDQLLQMEYLIDSGYYLQIVNEVFVKVEIEKVLDSITDLLGAYQLLEQVNTQVNKKAEDFKVKNKDILNVLTENVFSEASSI